MPSNADLLFTTWPSSPKTITVASHALVRAEQPLNRPFSGSAEFHVIRRQRFQSRHAPRMEPWKH